MQKPKDVIDVINNNYSKEYSNVHRGLHFLSEKATESYEEARRKVAKFINADEKEIIFTSGATASINLVAYSWGMENLSPNDEINLTIFQLSFSASVSSNAPLADKALVNGADCWSAYPSPLLSVVPLVL